MKNRMQSITEERKDTKETGVHFQSVNIYKKLFGVNQSGQLESTTDEINAYLLGTLKDPNRHQELGENMSLISPVSSSTTFD